MIFITDECLLNSSHVPLLTPTHTTRALYYRAVVFFGQLQLFLSHLRVQNWEDWWLRAPHLGLSRIVFYSDWTVKQGLLGHLNLFEDKKKHDRKPKISLFDFLAL